VRKLGLVTVARSDYGIYLPVLRKIQADAQLQLCLIVSGMHLAPEFGRTVEVIEEDGFEIAEKVEMLVASDTPEAIAKSMGLGLIGFAQAYARTRPDILIVLGDRFEMHAAALSALPFKIPVAHIHGGELTMGAIDDALRHSMTKLSHLHFVSTDEYARRVIQLGEEPWRVIVSGAPSLDNLQAIRLLSRGELEKKFGLSLNEPPLLVTYHPVTLEYEQTRQQTEELLAALSSFDVPLVFTAPNADTGGRLITQLVRDYVATRSSARLVDNLGTQAYFSLMAISAAMVGNSSSGIIEASAFKLPVVNIGTRQEGRVRGANVIDVGYRREEITAGVKRALSADFRSGLAGMSNPYGSGAAADKIVARLKEVSLDERLLVKRFQDLPVAGSPEEKGARI
jgi:UDP-N-acetylglucosamine 2-epimerase (non-hydrolysing)/GDP/UDP-N,N'-diacetylbacillosamine 2-epimerase (hydrolysing)